MKRTTAVFWLMLLAAITVSCRGTNTLPQRTLIITTADGTEISVTAEIAKKVVKACYEGGIEAYSW